MSEDVSPLKSVEPLLLDFSAADAAEFLLRPPQADRYAHDIFFAGFCTWVVKPLAPKLVRDAMVIQMLDRKHQIIHASRKPRRGAYRPKVTLEVKLDRLSSKKYRTFFAEFEEPLCRDLKQFLKTRSKPSIRKEITNRGEDLMLMVAVAETFHLGHELAADESILPPSWTRIKMVIGKFKAIRAIRPTGGKGATTLNNIWKTCRASLPLIYAAANIEVSPGTTLLDAILRGTLTYSKAQPFIADWFARSNYVASEILKRALDNSDTVAKFLQIPSVAPAPFAAPLTFSDSDRDMLADALRRSDVRNVVTKHRQANQQR